MGISRKRVALRPSVGQLITNEGDASLSLVNLQSSSGVLATYDSNYESDDSISVFERKLRVLL